MSNGSRPPVASTRRVVAAVLSAVAAFVMLYGVGRQSWSTVAIGAALLLLALGLLAVASARGGGSAWVVGTGHVLAVSEAPASSVFGRCEMQLVIDAPGVSPRSIKVRDPRVPVAKWPDLGATLPITVAVDDPRRVRVLWDEVLTHAEVAEEVVAAASASRTEEVFVSRRTGPRTAGQGAGPRTAGPGRGARAAPRTEPRTAPRAARGPVPAEQPLAEPVTMDLTDASTAVRPAPDPIVIHRTPGGRTIIEGVVVDQPPAATIPLPRLATESPSPPRQRETVFPDPAAGGVATATASSRTANDKAAPEGREEYDEFASVGMTLLVSDLDRSVRFYQRMLGLPVIDRGESNVVFASGSTRLVVRALREVAPVNRRLVHLNLEVADIAAAYARLRDRGVRFTYGPRVVNRGRKLEVWAAAFRDPDGHGIALTQWRDRAERATV